MGNWLDRTGYMTLAAFVGGALLAAIIAVLFFVLRDGGDDESPPPAPTATSTSAVSPTPTALPATPTPPAPASFGPFPSPDDAVAAFVQDELGGPYIGPCPPSAPSGEPIDGLCSLQLYRSAELATFNIGPFASEAIGEAVVLPDNDDNWFLSFFEFPPLDAEIMEGGTAMVFQAEDCLNFRDEPAANADVLSCQIDGTSARVVEGPVEAGDITWWRLEGLGWAAARFLAPVVQ